MKSLHAARDRQDIARRIRALGQNAPAKWGKFSAPQMVAHLTESMRMATGDLAVRQKKSIMRFPPLKQFIIYVMPMPKSVRTAPELLARAPLLFESEVEDLLRMMERFAARDPRASWPPHPLFGAMSGGEWGALAHKHIDHHLRQFGA